MITQVSLKNFKCLRDVTVNLERFTMFVGANGSGKTSFLQAIDLLCRTFRTVSQPGQWDGEYLQNRSFSSPAAVELSCLSDETYFRYRTFPIAQYQPHKWDGEGNAYAKSSDNWQQWQPQYGMLPNPVWLRLDPNALRSTQPSHDIRQIGDRGQGMHRALSSMMLERRNDFFKLEADLSRIVPSVRQLQPTAEHEIRFDTVNGKSLTASQVSEGTLLTLGLLTAIHGVNKPGVLLLDDLDRALHPKAQRELINLLRGVQTTNPEIQIVASTHSPYLLDSMQPNEVLVTSLGEAGSTTCEPLTHHPKYDKWKDEFHSGEMWGVFGEKWVIESDRRGNESEAGNGNGTGDGSGVGSKLEVATK